MPTVNITLKAGHQWSEELDQHAGLPPRVGQYRAFFDVAGDAITVTEVKRRNEHTY